MAPNVCAFFHLKLFTAHIAQTRASSRMIIQSSDSEGEVHPNAAAQPPRDRVRTERGRLIGMCVFYSTTKSLTSIQMTRQSCKLKGRLRRESNKRDGLVSRKKKLTTTYHLVCSPCLLALTVFDTRSAPESEEEEGDNVLPESAPKAIKV